MFLSNFSEYSNWFREPNIDNLWGTPYALMDCIEISSFITLLRECYFGEQGCGELAQSHQFSPGSIPSQCHMWVELFVSSRLALRGFSPIFPFYSF